MYYYVLKRNGDSHDTHAFMAALILILIRRHATLTQTRPIMNYGASSRPRTVDHDH